MKKSLEISKCITEPRLVLLSYHRNYHHIFDHDIHIYYKVFIILSVPLSPFINKKSLRYLSIKCFQILYNNIIFESISSFLRTEDPNSKLKNPC